uniref:Myosin motor domain-containing protein n=1 Tax=Aplanochytrium stocchinoi TaxID=215587 RepID=A0A7S3LN05_9STRA
MASKETVIKKFQKDMNSLVSTLSKTSQSFIRCIKPNKDQASHEWDVKLNLSQLNYLGITQAIRVHQDTYPIRRTFDFIASKYYSLLEENRIQYVPMKNDLEVCRAILIEKLGADSEFKLWQCGYTRVFLGNEVLFKLDSIVNERRLAELNAMSENERRKHLEEDRLRQQREIREARERMEREQAEVRRRKEEEERKRRIAQEEEERMRRIAQEEEERKRRIAEEEERKRRIAEEEEKMMYRIAEEEAKKKEELRLKEEEMQKRIAEEKEKVRIETENRMEQLRQEEKERKRLLAETEEKLKKDAEERKRKIAEEDTRLVEKQRELQEKLQLLEEEQQKKLIAEEERKKQLELENAKLKAEEVRLANIENERSKKLEEEENRLRKEKEKMVEEQAAKAAQFEAEKAKLKEEAARLKHLEEDRLLRLEKDKQEAERKEREFQEKLKREKEKKEKLRKKKVKAAAIAEKKKKNAEKLKRREAKISATTKFQSMIRGAIIRHRYRDAINRRRMFKDALEPNELVVMASLVMKKGMMGSRKYFMVLTSKLRLLLLDPKSVKVQEQINVDKKSIKATAKGKNEVTIYYKDGKLKSLNLHDFLNEPFVWAQSFDNLLDFTTEDYVKVGFERLFKGKVKRSAITVPLRCSHMSFLNDSDQSTASHEHLFILTIKQGRAKLSWFLNDADKEIRGQLAVDRNMRVTIPTEESIGGVLNHLVFVLNVKKKPKSKTYYLQCRSKYALNNWVNTLRYHVNEDRRKRLPVNQLRTMRTGNNINKKNRNSRNFDAEAFINQLDDDESTIQNFRTLGRNKQ